jgi:hypothetical protein
MPLKNVHPAQGRPAQRRRLLKFPNGLRREKCCPRPVFQSVRRSHARPTASHRPHPGQLKRLLRSKPQSGRRPPPERSWYPPNPQDPLAGDALAIADLRTPPGRLCKAFSNALAKSPRFADSSEPGSAASSVFPLRMGLPKSLLTRFAGSRSFPASVTAPPSPFLSVSPHE